MPTEERKRELEKIQELKRRHDLYEQNLVSVRVDEQTVIMIPKGDDPYRHIEKFKENKKKNKERLKQIR